MASEVQLCEDTFKLSIEVNQSHHNIAEILLRFQECMHEEVISMNGISALLSSIKAPKCLKCDIFQCPHYLLIQSYQKRVSQGSQQWISSPNEVFRRNTSDSDCQTDPEISGAPLESPFAVHESDAVCSPLILHEKMFLGNESMSINGFSLKVARKIAEDIRKVIRRHKVGTDIKTPIFVVCDGLDSQKTIFLGVGTGTLIKASCSPVFYGPDHLPTISHLSYNFVFGCYSKEVETSAEARYEILKRAGEQTSSVTIHCSWNRPSAILSLPAIDLLSDVELFVCPSDSSSAAHALQLELKLLEALISGSEEGEVVWGVKQRRETITEQLDILFEEVHEGKRDKPDQAMFELDNLIEQRFSEVRQNLDFTDQVWNVLKGSESYTQLQEGFVSIFEAINTDFIRPFVHQLDVTKLANSCKVMMRTEKTVNINELEPLKMLIEIGLEKLKRDYMSVFLASGLVTNDELKPFISWSSVKDDHKACLQMLKKLCMTLHCVVLLRKYINLPQTVLSHCTTNIFKRLINTEDTPQEFHFSIQNILLQEQFSSGSLSDWACKICCSGKSDQPKQMIYRITKTPLFSNSSNEDYVDKLSITSTKYYGFNLSVIPDSFIN